MLHDQRPHAGFSERRTSVGFFPFQHPKLVERPPSGDGWLHEIKFDGYRMQVAVEDGRATWRTRNGLDWSDRFRDLSAELAGFPDCVLDGELTAIDAAGQPSYTLFRAAAGRRQAGAIEGDLVLFVFDLLMLGGQDLRDLPLRQRKVHLLKLLEPRRRPRTARFRYVSPLPGDGPSLIAAACEIGLEGIVSKRLDSPYQGGDARRDTWVKVKCRPAQEVVVGGWKTEKGRFRSLLSGVWEDGKLRYTGSIHTGYSRDVVEALLAQLKTVETNQSPYALGEPPRKTSDIHWARPELIANVEFAEWTGSGKLRQASFKGLRDDKPVAEVVEEVAAPAPGPARPKHAAKGEPVEVLGVVITNPDKELWPVTGDLPPVTKADLARYYASAAEWMLPYLRGRPCTVLVAPDGITGPKTYVRHEGHWQGLLRSSADIRHLSVPEKEKTYPVFDTAKALVTAAEIGIVELHPWGSMPDEPMVPGMLVFDLDPEEGQSFEVVIDAANDLSSRLLDYGLVAFDKTSGQRGLHVVAPFTQSSPPFSWETAKAFAERLCRDMAAESPDLYTVALPKAQRRGRLFLDYLRNDPGHHAVGLLSPRATPEATVSMPVHLGSLRAGDVRRYTVRTALKALRQHDPWKYFDAASRPLVTAVERMQARKKLR